MPGLQVVELEQLKMELKQRTVLTRVTVKLDKGTAYRDMRYVTVVLKDQREITVLFLGEPLGNDTRTVQRLNVEEQLDRVKPCNSCKRTVIPTEEGGEVVRKYFGLPKTE